MSKPGIFAKLFRGARKKSNAAALPHGVDVLADIQRLCPTYRFTVIFDVGANTGRETRRYLSAHPAADIYCFEPVSEAHRLLSEKFHEARQVRCLNLAVGANPGEAVVTADGASKTNRIIDQQELESMGNQPTEKVEVTTLAQFCAQQDITGISFLKIDTEGADLDVLNGGKRLLEQQAVDFLQVEVGMNPSNDFHIPFEGTKQFLEDHGYFLFGLYEQSHEKPHLQITLRRTNAVFVSGRTIEQYPAPPKAKRKRQQ